MYPLDLMKQVIESLSKNYKVVLFGGGTNEVNILNAFEEQFENIDIMTQSNWISQYFLNQPNFVCWRELIDIVIVVG